MRPGTATFLSACLLGLLLAVPAFGDGFERVTLVEGLDQPTALAYLPDGRMLIAEKEGRVRLVEADGVLRPEPLLDISDHVNSYLDRGLLGIAVDAQWGAHPYLYLLYVHEDRPNDITGRKGARLTRVELHEDGTVGPEQVLLGSVGPPCGLDADCLPTDTSHTIGTVRSAPDGTLFVGSGDGWFPNVSIALDSALDTYDPRSLNGKILHVDREGRGVESHPYCPGADLDAVCAKVFATGLRNPFRFTLRPGGGLVIGDVGWEAFEELDIIGAGGGVNLGWPCREGPIQTPNYSLRADCRALYPLAPSPFGEPVHWYPNPRGAGRAIVGGPIYAGTGYPGALRGKVLFADTIVGFLQAISRGGGTPETLVEDLVAPVEVTAGPASMGGDAIVVELGAGRVSRIRHYTDDRTPIAVAGASPRYGLDVDEIAFDSAGSGDPLGQSVTYAWDFGDGETSTEPDPVHTYADPGVYVARLTVSDGSLSATAQVAVFPGLVPPEVAIEAPAAGLEFDVGDEIDLRGSASDGAALTWRVILHHGTHTHLLGRFADEEASFATIDNHDADSWYEIRLTARGADGLAATVAGPELRPRTTELTLRTEPAGGPIAYSGTVMTAPRTLTVARNYLAPIGAGDEFVADGRVWRFDHWAHGGTQQQVHRIPSAPLTLTAIYRDAGPASSGDDSGMETPPVPPPGPEVSRFSAFPVDAAGPAIGRFRLRRGRIVGRVSDPTGVRGVEVALVRRLRGGRCRFWTRTVRQLSSRRDCARPRWMAARRAGRRWQVVLGAVPRGGRYRVLVRASDALGNTSLRSVAALRRR